MQRIGRYEVVEHLASGGMGRVYLAKATGVGGFERHVVVKALHVRDDDDTLVTMFLDEARVLGALHHHCIAPVYEVGCDPDGRYFLVMDYVHGETVEGVMKASIDREVPVPLPFALTTVSAIASALDYAHQLRASDGSPLGIVHRDVSLSNIMIGYDGAVKLIDFGIAKSANRGTQTLHGTLKGKIGYLAPEQVRSRPLDHRADIFALGIVLYEMTTMTRAFCGMSELDTLERITKGQVVPPSQLVTDYPRALELIVMKALALDPADRYQDAGAMGRDIEALAHKLGLQLGHATVARTMRSLFDRARRRFARASSELAPTPTPPGIAVANELRPAPLSLDDLPTRRVPTFTEEELGEDVGPVDHARHVDHANHVDVELQTEDEVIELRAEHRTGERTSPRRLRARTSRERSFHGFEPAIARSGDVIARPVAPPLALEQVPPVVVRFSTPSVSEVMAVVAPPAPEPLRSVLVRPDSAPLRPESASLRPESAPLRLSGARPAVALPRMTGTSTAQMGRLGGAPSPRLQLLLGILAALLVLALVLR